MNKGKSKQSAKPELATKLGFGVDTAGMWFSAIVLFAVLLLALSSTARLIFALRRMIPSPGQPRVCDSLNV